jgi:hypothetical protein
VGVLIDWDARDWIILIYNPIPPVSSSLNNEASDGRTSWPAISIESSREGGTYIVPDIHVPVRFLLLTERGRHRMSREREWDQQ